MSERIKQALCLACGADKTAPLAPCEACGHALETSDDQARHLLQADFEFTPDELQAAREHLKAGGALEFAPDALTTASAALRADKSDPHWLLFWLVIVLPIVLFALYFWLNAE